MFNYLLRRLILLPITLFCIVLVNFVIINLAPGDPVSVTEISPEGALRREGASEVFGNDDRYLQFREHYGLTLPILFNNWPQIDFDQVERTLWVLEHRRYQGNSEEMPAKDYNEIRIGFGDRAKYIMPHLVKIMSDMKTPLWKRLLAGRYFVRGATRQGITGPSLTHQQQDLNQVIARDNQFLRENLTNNKASEVEVDKKNRELLAYYAKEHTQFAQKSFLDRARIFFFETRFTRYLSRVLTLDFGTLRDDNNKTVISEVAKRFKYSLTLSIIPMFVTFFLCLILGFAMAVYQSRWIDHFLNVVCLIFYAIPVFVVVPFLIEKVALNGYFPFTHIPIPLSGFTSPDRQYEMMSSGQRLMDVLTHIALPLLAVSYGGIAAQARLARTSILEVLRQDYVRTARAKGLSPFTVLWKHVGRNAAITLVTSIASSLGVILGGSLIIETLFEINGFGKFFYDAVINRDYNVVMFSALAGAFLSLAGYLAADIAYTILDPRVSLE